MEKRKVLDLLKLYRRRDEIKTLQKKTNRGKANSFEKTLSDLDNKIGTIEDQIGEHFNETIITITNNKFPGYESELRYLILASMNYFIIALRSMRCRDTRRISMLLHSLHFLYLKKMTR